VNELRVWKYQATGNDFVMTFDPDDERPLSADEVEALCDRRFGVGADGAIRIGRGSDDRPFMDYRNADGSIAEMCGNGLRCVALLLRDLGVEEATAFEVDTRAGVRSVELLADGRVRVDMGAPGFTKAAIPMRGPAWETFVDQPIDVGGAVVPGTALSMGNPHLVLFLDEEPEWPQVAHVGPVLEGDGRFPEGTNVEFAYVDDGEIVARVWERGSGETLACGSGACAIGVAAHEMGLAERATRVRYPGGVLDVDRDDDGSVSLTGPVARVLEGVVDLDTLFETRPR
jgi:diaminopimelate epimerase